jgi:tetratricopeptide (TPR) repeat protein
MPSPDLSTNRDRRITIAAILAFFLLVLVGWFLIRPYYQLQVAETYLQKHDDLAAQNRLKSYLADHPDDAKALLLLAQAARGLGEYGNAERYLTASEEKSGPTDRSRFELLLLGLCQGDYVGEEQKVKTLADRNQPDAFPAMEALAKGYFVAYRHREVTEICDRLLAKTPDHTAALLLRGSVSELSRKHDAAEKDFREAVERDPHNAMARATLAQFLTQHGHTREALAHFQLVQNGGASSASVLLSFARALVDAGDLDGADRKLDELLIVYPDHPDACVEKGRLALRREKLAESLTWLKLAIKAAPWHREGHLLLAAVHSDLQQADEAARHLAIVDDFQEDDGRGGAMKLRARDNPGDVSIRWSLWQWCERTGKTEEGITWLTEILRVNPDHSQAHTALADYFDRTSQPRRAAVHRNAAAGKK